MPTFKRFEDIVAWQKARELTRLVYQTTTEGRFAKDFGLRDQLQRSSVSIMANIAVAETQSHLYVAVDLGYIDETAFSKLYSLLDEVSRMTIALAQHLQGTRS
jgi:hypothetical protein